MNQSEPEIPIADSFWDLMPEVKRFSHNAMATTFQIFIIHNNADYAGQAARAAFNELDRLEQELSRFIENSDVSRINAAAANQPIRAGLDAFECIRIGMRMYAETNGAFDITIGSLLSCWLNKDKTTRTPTDGEIVSARKRTGAHLVEMDDDRHTIQLSAEGVKIDLGGIGKGYAVDKMAEFLRDWSIDCALVHGGRSSVFVFGAPPGTKGWPITLSSPYNQKNTLARFCLNGCALGGSGLQQGRHIIDPRIARPVEDKQAAWARASTAAVADVLSTAFMVMTPQEIKQYCTNHPDTPAMVVTAKQHAQTEDNVLRFGHWDDGGIQS